MAAAQQAAQQMPGQQPVQMPGQQPAQMPGQQPAQMPGQQPVQMPGQQPPYQGNPYQGGMYIPPQQPIMPMQPSMTTELKELLTGLFKAPGATLQKAMTDPAKNAQYLLGGISTLIILILVMLIFPGELLEYGFSICFKIAFGVAFATAVIRIVYGIIFSLAVRKHNPSLNVQTAIGMSCVTLVLDAIVVLLIFLMVKIAMYEIVIALVLFWLVSSVISGYLLASVMSGGNGDATFLMSLLIQLILLIVLVFVIRGVVTNAATSAASSALGGMSDLFDMIY